jgi:hypothetical protein
LLLFHQVKVNLLLMLLPILFPLLARVFNPCLAL